MMTKQPAYYMTKCFDYRQSHKEKQSLNEGTLYGSGSTSGLHPCSISYFNSSFKSEGIQARSPPALLALFYYT